MKKDSKYLTKKEREILSPNYPFMRVKNELIYELWQKGLKQRTLMNLTGLSKSSVSRICIAGTNREIKNTNSSVNTRLKMLNKSLESFYEEMKKIIKSFN